MSSTAKKKQEDGKPKELIDDLAAISWTGRPVFIVFDSDIETNRQVQLAEFELAKLLGASRSRRQGRAPAAGLHRATRARRPRSAWTTICSLIRPMSWSH